MSHTSQRRGLSPERPGEELIVLAMVPARYQGKPGVSAAMSRLAELMLGHGPKNWLSRNFPDLEVPQIGSVQPLIRGLERIWPESTRAWLFHLVAGRSSVITALYTEPEKVVALLQELQGNWLNHNRAQGLPISITLSGLFSDIRRCCRAIGRPEHTYLHSLGFYGPAERLPADTELELLTMCGHGLVSVNLVRRLVEKIQAQELSARQAAEEIAKPCICGIVNPARAEKIFLRLAQNS